MSLNKIENKKKKFDLKTENDSAVSRKLSFIYCYICIFHSTLFFFYHDCIDQNKQKNSKNIKVNTCIYNIYLYIYTHTRYIWVNS